MAEAQATLLTYRNEYTFKGVEYAPLLYKIIMWLATIDYIATMQTLQENLQNLGVFAATVNGDINKIRGKFDRNHSQLLVRGTTVDNPIGLLFDAYSVVPCHTTSRSTSAATMMTGLLGSSLESPMKPS